MSKIVIAFGGNALGNNPKEQQELIKKAVKNVVPLVKEGHQIIIGHGNGPQVGVINLAFEDSYVGVLANKDAGIEVVNVYDRYADKDRERINEIADYSIKDYTEFLKLIENPNKKYKKVI